VVISRRNQNKGLPQFQGPQMGEILALYQTSKKQFGTGTRIS